MAFPDFGPLAEDSAAKLKRSQLNVCTVYSVLFPPPLVAATCACKIGLQILSVLGNSKVWGKWYGLAECLIFHS